MVAAAVVVAIRVAAARRCSQTTDRLARRLRRDLTGVAAGTAGFALPSGWPGLAGLAKSCRRSCWHLLDTHAGSLAPVRRCVSKAAWQEKGRDLEVDRP
jgi:hypothetical protein